MNGMKNRVVFLAGDQMGMVSEAEEVQMLPSRFAESIRENALRARRRHEWRHGW